MAERAPQNREPAAAGQPRGELVDAEYVRERLGAFRLSRREMLRLGRGRIAARTLQRIINTPSTRLSLSSAESLAEILGCGCRDVFVSSPFLADRIARFGLLPRAPSIDGSGSWVVRPEERRIQDALAARRPVVVLGGVRTGKTSLARRIARRTGYSHAHGTLWLSGAGDPARAQELVAECLCLFPPGAGGAAPGSVLEERFAGLLWSRRRLLVVDDVADASFVHRLLGRFRGPMDLLVVTDRELTALELERELGERPIGLVPLADEQVFAFLGKRHGPDGRLGLPEGDRGTPALLERALQGDAAALSRARELVDRARGADPGWRTMLDAVAGRPDAMQFASDLLASTRFRSLREIAEVVATSDEVNSPLLRDASPEARRLLGCLGLFDAEPVPLDWAVAAARVEAREVRLACDELRAIVGCRGDEPGDGRIAVAPHLRPYASRALSNRERGQALERVCRKAIAVAHELAAVPPAVASAALHAQEGAFLGGLRHLASRDGAGGTVTLVDALLPVCHLLPAWRRDGVDELLRVAIAFAERAALRTEALKLKWTLGRWLVSVRADFVSGEELFRESAAGFAAEGLLVDAAEACGESAVALFATLRTSLGVSTFRRATEYARGAGAAPELLARHLANQAFAESRLRGGDDGMAGWRRAGVLLDEAGGLLAACRSPTAREVARVVACNRAVAGSVLGVPGWREALAGALRDAVAALPPGDILAAYHLSTATAAGIGLAPSLEAQRRMLRAGWARLLRSRGPAIGVAIRRIGQMAFYLNNLDTGDGTAWHANGGVLATDPDPPHVLTTGGLLPVTFLVEPMQQVFDWRFLEAAKRFLWKQGGPNLGRVFAEVEARQALGPGRTGGRSRRVQR